MTEHEQQIAMVEFCGSNRDYLHDLNAMHEAEKILMPERWSSETCNPKEPWPTFVRHLSRICKEDKIPNEHADADQRREAFLRTIMKWKE